MSESAAIRFGIGLCAAVASIAWFAYAGWSWGGIGGLFALFVVGSILAEAAYRHFATHEEKIGDLTDRVRNPD